MFTEKPEFLRLFFALWPDPAVRSRLAAVAAELQRDVSGRWVKPENLHVTLAFLGSVGGERVDELNGIARALQASRCELTLDRLEFWPRRGILCISPTAMPSALGELALSLRERLREAGFPVEERPFRVHLTLARKARADFCIRSLADPVLWKVDSLALVQSETAREGATYTVQAAWRLDGKRQAESPGGA